MWSCPVSPPPPLQVRPSGGRGDGGPSGHASGHGASQAAQEGGAVAGGCRPPQEGALPCTPCFLRCPYSRSSASPSTGGASIRRSQGLARACRTAVPGEGSIESTPGPPHPLLPWIKAQEAFSRNAHMVTAHHLFFPPEPETVTDGGWECTWHCCLVHCIGLACAASGPRLCSSC